MKKTAKALLLVLCALILVVGSVFGTLAYLTSQDEVTNTFTIGEVKIEMDEAKVDVYGNKLDNAGNIYAEGATIANRVKVNDYLIIPSHTYVKDPTIYVTEDSETCYVFIKVVNDIAAIESGTTVAQQIAANGWTAFAGEAGVYWQIVEKDAADKTLETFANFTISKDVIQAPEGTTDYTTNPMWIENYAPTTVDGNVEATTFITVTAYAVQKDGIANETAAWAALNPTP